MVRHCINPACHVEFTLFHGGYLYAHERQMADTEFIWLCSSCGGELVPFLAADGAISVMPRSGQRSLRPPRANGYLRMVAAPKPQSPWSSAVPAGLRQPEPPATQWKEGPLGSAGATYKLGDRDKSSAA